MLTDQMLQNTKIRWSLFSAVTILISLTLYRNSLLDLMGMVLRREESSHGLFIPFISAFFMWKQRRKLVLTVPEFDLALGMSVVLIGLLLRYALDANNWILHPGISYFYCDCRRFHLPFGKEIISTYVMPDDTGLDIDSVASLTRTSPLRYWMTPKPKGISDEEATVAYPTRVSAAPPEVCARVPPPAYSTNGETLVVMVCVSSMASRNGSRFRKNADDGKTTSTSGFKEAVVTDEGKKRVE